MTTTPKPMLPLFNACPVLGDRLPHVSLGDFPTPVEEMPQIAAQIGAGRLFIKRDDLSGQVYGGNKVRKLEFLFGKIIRTNAREVMTIGFAGSNHALATAIYARQLGLDSISLLLPQVNARYLRRNLLASHHYHARLCHYDHWMQLSLGMLGHVARGVAKHQALPRFIPPGGSCPLGIVGYVNAALELKGQIAEGKLPEPDVLYVPLGSMGTAAGLMIGLRVAGLKTRVVPVRVIEASMASRKRMLKMIRETASFLHRLDPSFAAGKWSRDDLAIRDDCLGRGYGHFTEKGVEAAALMRKGHGITLNGTYSAKAFSALLDDAAKRLLNEKTVLFWNTYNSRDLVAITQHADYHRLPKAFHRYFDQELQPLDDGDDGEG